MEMPRRQHRLDTRAGLPTRTRHAWAETLEPRRLLSSAVPSVGATEGEVTSFELLSGMVHVHDHLDYAAANMGRIHISYHELYAVHNGQMDMSRADEARVRRVANEVADRGQRWVINIEHWPSDIRVHGRDAVDATIRALGDVVRWAKDERPDVEVGFYGIVPQREYWTPVTHALRVQQLEQARSDAARDPGRQWSVNLAEATLAASQTRMDAWRAANDYLRPLADLVDFVAPSLYTFYDDQAAWQSYARANLDMAAAYGKPVLPFLWATYHNSNRRLAGTDLPGDVWRRQLDFVRDHADGVVVWRDFTPVESDADWWRQTVAFGSSLVPTVQKQDNATGRTSRETPAGETPAAPAMRPARPATAPATPDVKTETPRTTAEQVHEAVRALKADVAVANVQPGGIMTRFAEIRRQSFVAERQGERPTVFATQRLVGDAARPVQVLFADEDVVQVAVGR